MNTGIKCPECSFEFNTVERNWTCICGWKPEPSTWVRELSKVPVPLSEYIWKTGDPFPKCMPSCGQCLAESVKNSA